MPPMGIGPRAWRGRILLERTLMIVGVAMLAYVWWQYAQAAFTQAQLIEQLRAAQQRRPPAPATPAAQSDQTPFPWGLSVPRIGVSVAVVDGDDQGTLGVAAGRIPGTGMPGRAGTIGIAAHRDTFFRNLRDVVRGDRILLETPDRAFEYRVVSTSIVRPEDTWVLRSGRDQALVLVTCYPFAFIGHAPLRFVVRAVADPSAG